MKVFNVSESINLQREYCKKTEAPHFAPSDGVCWDCGKNIYEELPKKFRSIDGTEKTIMRGISTEEAEQALVTGCPHCNRSYCD